MNLDTPIAPFLMGGLVLPCALMSQTPVGGLFSESIQELGTREVEELLLDWLNPFLTVEDEDMLKGWLLGSEPLVFEKGTL